MTYIIPHFRYGALVFNDIRNEHEPKDRSNRIEILQKMLR